MEFISTSLLPSSAEMAVWKALETAFQGDEGLCFLGTPMLMVEGLLREADIVLVHRVWGIYVIEVRSYKIGNIVRIDDRRWELKDWGGSSRPPHQPAQEYLSAIFERMQQLSPNLTDKVSGYALVALPEITRAEWDGRALSRSKGPSEALIFRDELEPEALRKKLNPLSSNSLPPIPLSDSQWQVLRRVFLPEKSETGFPLEEESEPEDFVFVMGEDLMDSDFDASFGAEPELEDDQVVAQVPVERMNAAPIFVSYRRDDSAWATGRIFDALRLHFGTAVRIFMDTDYIQYGDRFDNVIQESVKSCNVMLVIIGERWLTICHEDGRRRLDDVNDFVRLELSTALDRGIHIIPVLLDGTFMPEEASLPEPLKGLARYHAIELRPETFPGQIQKLIDRLDEILKKQRA